MEKPSLPTSRNKYDKKEIREIGELAEAIITINAGAASERAFVNFIQKISPEIILNLISENNRMREAIEAIGGIASSLLLTENDEHYKNIYDT
ncbi:TPA: hypothetical protein ACF3ML_005907 [Pseudomonas aeruginosa]